MNFAAEANFLQGIGMLVKKQKFRSVKLIYKFPDEVALIDAGLPLKKFCCSSIFQLFCLMNIRHVIFQLRFYMHFDALEKKSHLTAKHTQDAIFSSAAKFLKT